MSVTSVLYGWSVCYSIYVVGEFSFLPPTPSSIVRVISGENIIG